LKSCFEIPQQLERAENSLVACWRWKEVENLPVEEKHPSVSGPLMEGDLLTLDRISIRYGRGRKAFTAAHEVSFTIGEGETFALVGESGSGKSTIARAISGLVPPVEGTVSLHCTPLPKALKERTREQRRVIQFIFQNPDASLNPRAKIRSILARPLQFFFGIAGKDVVRSVKEALTDVRLDAGYADRYGDQLSCACCFAARLWRWVRARKYSQRRFIPIPICCFKQFHICSSGSGGRPRGAHRKFQIRHRAVYSPADAHGSSARSARASGRRGGRERELIESAVTTHSKGWLNLPRQRRSRKSQSGKEPQDEDQQNRVPRSARSRLSRRRLQFGAGRSRGQNSYG
jgi:ABC-type transport system involved in cytochrome c biogenesis ATPase subunit